MAHARLRRQVRDGAGVLHGVRDRAGLGDVGLNETKRRMRELLQPRRLQRRVVVVVEIVEANDRPALGEQGLGDMKADKTGGAGDQDWSVGSRPTAP